jgi:hypothetical protein
VNFQQFLTLAIVVNCQKRDEGNNNYMSYLPDLKLVVMKTIKGMDMMRNHVDGLHHFIKSWDKAHDELHDDNFIQNRGRNNNIKAPDYCFKATNIYAKWEPEFERSIDSGVRELVVCLIEKLHCITYSSCAGHTYKHRRFSLRHVGIVPRSSLEYHSLLKVLRLVAKVTNSNINNNHNTVKDKKNNGVKLVINEDIVTSDGPSMPCIDLIFVPIIDDQVLYFQDLEYVYGKVIELLQKLSHLDIIASRNY